MVTTAISFFIILSLLVFIHELGHYLMARIIGVHVEEFGLGIPPRLFGKKIGKTIYSLNWLPIGGFVKLAGEDQEEGQETKIKQLKSETVKQYFWARSKKERAAILLAGVSMNFLLAVGITTYLLTQGMLTATKNLHVIRVLPGSPAEVAGLQPDDVLVSIKPAEGISVAKELDTPTDLISYVATKKGVPLTVDVKRGELPFTVQMTPRVEFPAGEGPLGVAISNLETRKLPLVQAPWEAVKINVSRAYEMLASVGTTLYKLVTFQRVDADVAGPIGIAKVTGEAVKFGWHAVLEFMSILSLNLAVLNALPIPALDGGRLLFVVLEKFIGKRVKPAFERGAHQWGMMILLGLILLVSLNDILKLAKGL